MNTTPKGQIIRGYKATNADITCNGFQFTVGEWHECNGELELCKNGFHFCEYPSGPWSYHNSGRLWEVEAEEVLLSMGPGADLKHVARRIRIIKEIPTDGNGNTGHENTGHWNTGDRNTGYRNTGHENTGDRNTGHWNTGDGNTGHGNLGDYHAGFLCAAKVPLKIFDRQVKDEAEIDWSVVINIAEAMQSDNQIDEIPASWLKVPNATEQRIRKLHEAHIKARAARRMT